MSGLLRVLGVYPKPKTLNPKPPYGGLGSFGLGCASGVRVLSRLVASELSSCVGFRLGAQACSIYTHNMAMVCTCPLAQASPKQHQ